MLNDDLLEQLKKVSQSIKTKEFLPFYYLYGNEDYFLTSIKKSMFKNFVDDTKLNIKTYTKENFILNEVIKYIGNVPFMNDKKLIVFDSVDYLYKTKNDKDAENLINAFENYKDINVIMFIKFESDVKYSKNYDKSNVFLNYFAKNGIAVNCKTLDEDSLKKYVNNHFKKAGFELDKLSLAYFMKTCGKNLNNLFNEADKLISYVGDKKQIDTEDIKRIVTKSIDDKIYNLIELYNSNKKEEAIKCYGDLLSEGEKPGTIFSVFADNYSNLIVCKDLVLRGKGQKEISDTMKIESWRVGKLMNATKFVDIDTLSSKMKEITDLGLSRVKGNIDEDHMVLLLMN